MEYAQAIDVLKNLADKPATSIEEKEAISMAIGTLSLGAFALSKVKEKKAKHERDVEW